MRRLMTKLTLLVAVVAVLGAACGGGTGDGGSSTTGDSTSGTTATSGTTGTSGSTGTSGPTGTSGMSHGTTGAPSGGGVDSPAAELRTGLTALLQEHVYLAGTATGTAIAMGPKDPATAAALETLDANSVALSDAIGSVYGDEGGKTFLGLWRKHIGFFVDYTLGAAGGDADMKQQAQQNLDGYRADFGAFIESATGGILTKEAVAEELKGHVESLEAAIDAQVAGSPDAFDKLAAAAAHMPMTADVLAGAIAQQFPEQFGS